MRIKKRYFGTLSSGKKVYLYTISNKTMSFSVTNFGCIITSIILPSVANCSDDVALGYPSLNGYLYNGPSFGCLVGPFANRIKDAQFTLDSVTYHLENNDNGNCLHSGRMGYQRKLWKAETFCNTKEAGIIFTYKSKDGEQGFPGSIHSRVCYSLTQDNEIILNYEVESNKSTHINLTNHTYFNLSGHDSGKIDAHEFQLFCDSYLPINEKTIPTGEIKSVLDTPYDFKNSCTLKDKLSLMPDGFDHCWIINSSEQALPLVAKVFDPKSNRKLSVFSSQPGVQFYTGYYLDNEAGKDNYYYKTRDGFCLETQHFPDTPNQKDFPSTLIRANQKYTQETRWVFEF